MATRQAHKIGSLLFCPDCGTLLDIPKDLEYVVLCEQCGHQEPASSFENIEITTRSHPDAFPSALHQKRKTQTKFQESDEALLTTKIRCEACGHNEAAVVERQMRGADEGTTVMYTCISCKHGWRANN